MLDFEKHQTPGTELEFFPMNYPAASSGVSPSLLCRHSVLDTESRRVFWIPAFAGITNSSQAAGNIPQRDLKKKERNSHEI